MEKRTCYFGTPKKNFHCPTKFNYSEALELIGPCTRITVEYGTCEEKYDPITSTWNKDHQTRKVLERYDVWMNENGIMILAIDFPKFRKI